MASYKSEKIYYAIAKTSCDLDVPSIRKETNTKCEGIGENRIKVWNADFSWCDEEGHKRILRQRLINLVGAANILDIEYGSEQ